MKRYDASRMIRFVATEEQKQWLLNQTHDMKSLSHVLRDLITRAMKRDNAQP